MMDADVKPMTTVEKRKRLNVTFFEKCKEELKKVTWTTKEELIFCTKAVIVATFFFGLAIYLVDLGDQRMFEFSWLFCRIIFG